MLQTLAIENYRSLRKLIVPLARLNVITGANGSGKSSLYRALRLLAETANGTVVASLAREGGLPSTLWAGPEKITAAMRSGKHRIEGTGPSEPTRLLLGFASDDLGYAVDLGLPPPSSSLFNLDPEIKHECIWSGPTLRKSTLLVERRGPLLRATDDNGSLQIVPCRPSPFESMMTEYADPRAVPEMIAVRDKIRSWRFYDHFRSDRQSPARQQQIGTYTPILSDDGSDVAAALATIREIGDTDALDAAIDDAFPKSRITITSQNGRFALTMQQHGLLRPLDAAELSDGTLRFLILVAALLTPRPPGLMVLNEPETSLHADLIPALSRLIVDAAKRSQVIVVSHNSVLIEAMTQQRDTQAIVLEKSFGETSIAGQTLTTTPPWQWPAR
jgi:predicted ATPase